MLDEQRAIFEAELKRTGIVNLGLLPTVKQVEMIRCIDPTLGICYMTSYEIQQILHHMNSHKIIYKRGNNYGQN